MSRLSGFISGRWAHAGSILHGGEIKVSKTWSAYQQVVVETYSEINSGKSSRIHVRPMSGEVFPTYMDVECSHAMRMAHPVGTKFRIHAKVIDKEGGKPFLYTRFDWPYEKVN